MHRLKDNNACDIRNISVIKTLLYESKRFNGDIRNIKNTNGQKALFRTCVNIFLEAGLEDLELVDEMSHEPLLHYCVRIAMLSRIIAKVYQTISVFTFIFYK
jgi:hypothetical protein